ncbi:hypothetical protein [Pontibacillus sp. HMF3514]|uniref:hypothetical protein n=1 Tax=Pontibacillus sp. HMF3514 TaxID=2692425 RepID=UPI00132017DF|nr:hypothetical protein [Pontibacillus sp. HMF3514]QHE52340.1 hypothetical protein GS400_09955 [Pontibacillus sp. HMF3514]
MNSRQMIFVGLSVFVGVYFAMRGFDLIQMYDSMAGKTESFRFLVFTITDQLTQQTVPLIAALLIGIGTLCIIIPLIMMYKKRKSLKNEPYRESTS